MGTWTLAMIAFGGTFAGMLFFNAMVRWFAAVWEVARPPREDGSRPLSLGLAVSVSLVSSGPWILVVVGFVAFHLREEPWFPWFIGGAVVGVGLLTLFVSSTLRRLKELKERNAA
jgi:hypothetical protein